MHSKKFRRRVLPIAMAALMVASCFPAMAANDPWTIADADETTLTYTIDGEELEVRWYADNYLKETGDLSASDYANAKVNVYVPEGADENSPILYSVNNSGWRSNSYKAELLAEGTDYSSDSNNTAMALKNGYVVVTAGLRSRGGKDSAGNWNHSPVTVADAKAVIRYLKHNDGIVGDTDRIFITGTSGGGALSVAIGSNGNSADFYEELYTIGAAGMTDAKTSTLTDDIYGVVAYCPITDLGHSDGSYEFTYAPTRIALKADGYAADDKGTTFALADLTMKLSPALAADWAEYVNAFGLKTEDGSALTAAYDVDKAVASGTLQDGTKALLIACYQEALDELGYDAFVAKLNERQPAGYKNGTPADGWKDFVTFSADKKTIEDIDMEGLTYYVALGQILKPGIAFTNSGVAEFAGLMFNENNLFGNPNEEVGYLLEMVYDESNLAASGSYASWDAYWAANGALLTKQSRMVDSIAYLTDAEDGDSAPYWWVRHGSNDRDTSFANQTLLYYAMINDKTIKTADFQFEFGLGHTGGYDTTEVEAFMAASIEDGKEAATPEQPTTPDQPTTPPTTGGTTGGSTGTSPKTGAASGMLPMVIASIAAVAGASVRGRKIR